MSESLAHRCRILAGNVAVAGCAAAFLVGAPMVTAQQFARVVEHRFKATLDAVIDWSNPLAVTVQKLQSSYAAEGFSKSPYYAWEGDDKSVRRARFGRHPYTNIEVELTAMNGAMQVEDALIEFNADGSARSVRVEFAAQADGAATCRKILQDTFKQEATLRSVPSPALGRVVFSSWMQPSFAAVEASSTKAPCTLGISRPEESQRLYVYEAGGQFVLACDLDFLLRFPSCWQITDVALDQKFNMPGFSEQPFFKWLTAAKDRMRFARQPFSNITVGLSLFDGKVPVEEATVDFENGAATRVNLSVYNRGDSGEISVPEFESLYKACGQALGQLLKVSPRSQPATPGAAVKTTGWMWDSSMCVALMEHNEIGKGNGKASQPEFLRIKLAPPQKKDWNFGVAALGQLSTTVGRSTLAKNVQREISGDVHIGGVPMVDQGDKGYCVVASCQRLFEYYHIPCDQHEMAQLVGADAQRGTNSLIMEAALSKIDNQFKTRFKPLISATLRNDRSQRSMNEAKYLALVKEYVEQGMPLLWTLELGVAREEPPLPVTGQMVGGHMRMIIGYNTERKQVLFTDSWGAGHELKRMALSDAMQVTTGLYVMQPRTY